MADRNVSIFDLDGTISKSDTYLVYLLGALRHRPSRWHRIGWLVLSVCLFRLSVRDNSWLKETFLNHILGGMSRDAVEAYSNKFVDKLMVKGLRANALKEIQQKRIAGDLLILATASLDIYVTLLARRIGFDHVICSQVQWSASGYLTGKLSGNNCYGLEKLKQIKVLLNQIGSRGLVCVYTDHHSDASMLEWSDIAFAINPTPRLRQLANAKQITIRRWH